MKRRLFSPGRLRRVGGRNHFTKPEVEALEPRWLLTGDAALAQAYGQLPLSFQLNEGQTAPQVAYLSQGSGYALFLTPTESVLSLQTPAAPGTASDPAAQGAVLSMQLVGASASPQMFMARTKPSAGLPDFIPSITAATASFQGPSPTAA